MHLRMENLEIIRFLLFMMIAALRNKVFAVCFMRDTDARIFFSHFKSVFCLAFWGYGVFAFCLHHFLFLVFSTYQHYISTSMSQWTFSLLFLGIPRVFPYITCIYDLSDRRLKTCEECHLPFICIYLPHSLYVCT